MTYAERVRAFCVREMGEEAVAKAERLAKLPQKQFIMGDKAKLAKIEALVRGGTADPYTAGAILQILGVKP